MGRVWIVVSFVVAISNFITLMFAPRLRAALRKGRDWICSLREEQPCGFSEAPPEWLRTGHPIVIAHAGGGIGHFIYTNSREAIEASIARGVKVLEVDVCFTADGVPVLSHDFEPDGEIPFGVGQKPTLEQFLSQKICGVLTPLTLRQLMNDVKKWGEVSIFVDSKKGDAVRLAKWLAKEAHPERFRRWIFQVTSEREVLAFRAAGIASSQLHFNAELRTAQRAIPWMVRQGIRSVSLCVRQIVSAKELQPFKAAGIHPFVWTVNHASTRQRVLDAGAAGYFTDWLLD